MNIQISTENCSPENYFIIEESADSVIKLTISYPKIVSMQSRKKLIDDLINDIQADLGKFKWLISGSVLVDFVWYLNAVERQETDVIGDIDNISKPVQDALCGPNGIIIDDSQIAGLYSHWRTRNGLLSDNVLVITIKFNNDMVIMKKNLIFVQYYQAICLPLNVDFSSIKNMVASNIIIKNRLRARNTAKILKKLDSNVDNYLVTSDYDFHRTRLNLFSSQTISLKKFKGLCKDAGLKMSHYFDIFKKRTITFN